MSFLRSLALVTVFVVGLYLLISPKDVPVRTTRGYRQSHQVASEPDPVEQVDAAHTARSNQPALDAQASANDPLDSGVSLDPRGPVSAEASKRAAMHRQKMIEARGGAPAPSFALASWEQLGPGNAGGRTRAFVIDPGVPNRMLLGAAGGGIWLTTNDGASWSAVDDSLANISISCMAMDPNDRTTLYAGTGENAFRGSSSSSGQGVYKSVDAGLTWSLLASTGPSSPVAGMWRQVTRVAVSPLNSDRVIATTTNGVWVSCDAGTTWSRTLTGDTKDVVFHPTDGCRAVVARNDGSIFFTNSGGRDCSGAGGVCPATSPDWTQATLTGNPASTTLTQYRVDNTDPMNPAYFLDVDSTSDFVKDEPITAGDPPMRVNVTAIVDGDTLQIGGPMAGLAAGDPVVSVPDGRSELAWSRSSSNIVYAAMNVSQGVIWKSINGGQDFSLRSNLTYLNAQGEYNNALWVDPNDAETLLLAGVGMYRSRDGGLTIEDIGCISHPDIHIIVEHPGYEGDAVGSTNKRIYVGSDGGLYVTDDIFAPAPPPGDCSVNFGWMELNNNLGITQGYFSAISAGGKIFTGTQDNGVWLHDAAAPGAWDLEDWTKIRGGDGWECDADPSDPNILYTIAGPNPGKGVLLRSTDAGINLDTVPGSPDPASPYMVDRNNPNRLISGQDRLWVTENIKADTPTWRVIKEPVNPMVPDNWFNRIGAVAITPGASNVMWVGHWGGDIYRSTAALSGGCPTGTCATCSCWTKVDDPAGGRQLPDRVCTSIEVDPNDTSRVYITFGPWNFESDNVWMTENALATQPSWRPITGFDPTPVAGTDPCDPALRPATALPCEPVSLILPHQDQSGLIYVGTWFGLYASDDFGATWARVDTPVPSADVRDLDWETSTRLVVTTHGRGLLRADRVFADCNRNTIPDGSDLFGGSSLDCNGNSIPDECDIGGISTDCNLDGEPDECYTGPDCNGNGIIDACEGDCNGNGQPDECDIAAAPPVSLFAGIDPARYGRDSSAIVSADFNGDGFDDLATTIFANESGVRNAVVVYLNLGEDGSSTWLGWDAPAVYTFSGAPSMPWALTTLDLDGDGDTDLAALVANNDTAPCTGCSDVHVGTNNGAGVFSWFNRGPKTLGLFPPKEVIAGGDTDGDGRDDVILADAERGEIYFETSVPLYVSVGGDPSAVAVGRFNPDGYLDVAAANSSLAEVEVLMNDGSGNFGGDIRRIAVGGTPVSIDVGDVNQDGFLDIVVATTTDIAILINQTDGDFVVASDPGALPATTIRLVDLDRDTWLDIVTTEDSPFISKVRLNNRDGTFAAPISFTSFSGVSLASGQFNGDGFVDMASITSAAIVSVAGNDTIVDCNDNGVPDTCDVDAGWPDSDNDGLLDVCEGEGCDLDGDGDCDLADWRIMVACLAGPDVPCPEGASRAALGAGRFRADLDGDFDFDLRDYALFTLRFAGERDCCKAPHAAGCLDFDVQSCVCASRPECCATEWTAVCAVAVELLRCGSCSDRPGCGDEVCNLGEDCTTCPQDCGACAGNCCAPNDSLGCESPIALACVCDLDPTCCSGVWTAECASLASSSCRACCGDAVCGAGETCRTCLADCGDCEVFCGDDACEADETCVNCSLDCGPCLGACCSEKLSSGCEDLEIQGCVCDIQPSCCEGAWDESCAGVANDNCKPCCGDGVCAVFEDCKRCPTDCGECADSCCLAHSAPGCIDKNVEGCVCSFDADCCEVAWDDVCATEAEQCGSCGGDCCAANKSAGCDDLQVEACVCAVKPACCEVDWTTACVDAVTELNCGVCADEPPEVTITSPPQDTTNNDVNFTYDGFNK